VRRLYERLDDSDKLEQRTERTFMIGAGITVFSVLALLAVMATRGSQAPPFDYQCVQDARVDALWKLKKELAQDAPGLTSAQVTTLLDRRYEEVKPAAIKQCETARPK
jgi:hypothetical protein